MRQAATDWMSSGQTQELAPRSPLASGGSDDRAGLLLDLAPSSAIRRLAKAPYGAPVRLDAPLARCDSDLSTTNATLAAQLIPAFGGLRCCSLLSQPAS